MNTINIANGTINPNSFKIRRSASEKKFLTPLAFKAQLSGGLSALGEYNKASINLQFKKYPWELDCDDKNLIKAKELLEEFCDYEDSETPDNRTLSYVISNFCDTRGNERDFERDFLQANCVLEKLQTLTSFQKEKFFSSKFMSYITSLSENKAFKLSCICLPDNIDELDKMLDDDLIRAFTKDYFSNRIGTWVEFSNLLSDYQKNIDSAVSLSKTKYGKEFYDLLIQRNAEDIKELSDILLPRLDNMSIEEVRKTQAILKKLLESKTPEGNYIFGYSNSCDTSRKMSLDGVVNILDASQNDSKKYEQLTNLLNLTQQGKIPPRVLGILAKKGKINEEFLNETIKLNSNILNILSFNSEQEAIEHSETADVVKINEKLFYNCDNELIPLKMDEKTFNELFPTIETLSLGQGELGDCYLVSAIYDFIKNPLTKVKIYQMFEQKGDDIIVTIPDSKEFPIVFSKKAVEKDGRKNINASIGIQMLEDAYRQTRSLKYGRANNLTMLEGGMQKNVYNAFLNKQNAKSYGIGLKPPKEEEILEDIEKISKDLDELKKENLEETQLSDDMNFFQRINWYAQQKKLNSIRELEAIQRGLQEILKTVDFNYNINEDELCSLIKKYANDKNYLISAGTKQGDVLDDDRLIYGAHAYSILATDNKNEIIKVVNPWNTATFVNLTFDEFLKYFDTINVVKI